MDKRTRKRKDCMRIAWMMKSHCSADASVQITFHSRREYIFDPTGGTRRHVEYARFVHENGKKSTPFSSAAGVMIVQTVRGISKALMAATASGRERTVEGVANAILRMLLLEKGAGDAVEAIDAYVDQRDGRSHCSPKMNERLKLSFNYVCDSLAHRKPKRTVMAAERRSQAPHVTMALSQQYDDYNYASGF
ncbi:hypothetical protein Y032_0172g383 [Ancylostoma ceylanicum]|uniref:Uncharacterized protein n=1 Tax=Ancylostoma ceylanicum TaxID=53326 RepID=A0A016SV78_9BILA|nr:hypothetical protein Y032_0172g383 [Ancylostoma ceylanicum]